MTVEIAIIFGLLTLAVVLFATEKISVAVITLLLLSVLVVSRILTPAEAFAGFSSDVMIILGSIFVLGGTLQRTGVLDGIAVLILKLAGSGLKSLTAGLMLTAGAMSAFMNNTTVAAMFVPPVTGLARRAGVSASKLLMPMAFAAIMGGTCTLIGTSTNIAVSGYISKEGLQPLGLFEIAPIGIVSLVAGVAFIVLFGQRLIPVHEDDVITDSAEMRNYLAEVVVLPHSPLVGEHAVDWELALVGFRLVQIARNDVAFIPDSNSVIEAGDTLLVEGEIENLRKARIIEGLKFKSGLDAGEMEGDAEAKITVAEAIILPGSELGGSTLQEMEFQQRYGLTVLAINRGGQPLFGKLAGVRLREADVLLVHGTSDRIEALLRPGSRLQKLGVALPENKPVGGRHGAIALSIFVLALVAGGAGWVPMPGAFLTGAVLVILSGCITAEKALEFVDWRLLILVGGMTAFGTAMDKTGAADLLAGWVLVGLSPFGVMAVLSGFFILTIILTQPMSNAAAALVVLPVAMSAANEMGADPRTFAIAIMLAASISFIAPLEPASLLVYGAGKYRFRDFLTVGGLLTILLSLIILLLLPLLWPLRPDGP